jgi:plastocyanin
MRRVALIALAGVLAVSVSNAAAAQRAVSIKNNAYTPGRAIAVAGDTVRWTNNEAPGPDRTHTVTSTDFPSSGALLPGEFFTSGVFVSPGTFAYHCDIHPFMQGTVAVYDLYFVGPGSSVRYGTGAPVSGYAPEAAGTVQINKVVSGVPSFVKTVAVNATTGKFATTIPAIPGQYQAVTTTPSRTSSLIRVNVRPRLSVTKRKQGKTFWLTVKTTPNQTGATIVLDRKRSSGWKKVAAHRLGTASKTTFKVVTSTRISVRFRLINPVHGYSKTTSGTLALRP